MANEMSASNSRSHAISMANKSTKELEDLISGLIVKAEEVAAGPITTLTMLRKVYGDEVLLTEFPRLGTDEADDDVVPNTYCEHYTAQVTKDGETKSKAANFFTDFYETLDIGKAQSFILAQIKMADSKDDNAKAEEKYRQMNPETRKNLKKKTTNAKSKGRGYIRKGIGCFYVMSDLYDVTRDVNGKKEPVCTLEYAEGHNENSFPLNLIDHTRVRMYRPMAPGDVLKLDVAEAVKAGGNLYDALEKQLSRGTKDKKNALPQITNPDAFYDFAARMVDYFASENSANITEVKKRMAQKKGGELLIRMVAELRSTLSALWNNELQVKYDRMIDKELAASEDTGEMPKALTY